MKQTKNNEHSTDYSMQELRRFTLNPNKSHSIAKNIVFMYIFSPQRFRRGDNHIQCEMLMKTLKKI